MIDEKKLIKINGGIKMKRTLVILMLLALSVAAYGQLFINEIDYDQPGIDAAEFIELAGPAGTYTNVVIDLINGTGGASYNTITIPSLTLSDESNGYGFYVIGVAAVTNVDNTPSGFTIQNGAPDGIQLSVNGTIVDAVAYEGAMNDLAGNPMEDVDSFGDDMYEGTENQSISHIGLDGSPWVVTTSTPGAINTGQILATGTNYPPVANAGLDQLVYVNTSVTLDGSASSDPNNNIATYQWIKIAGTASPTLANANSATTTFTSPASPDDLTYQLVVTDSLGLIARDTVSIAVREQADSKLIISEYIEGSSNNKAYELFNISDEAVDLAPYVIKVSRDGNGWGNYAAGDARDALVLDLTGTVAAGDVYVVANAEADASVLAQADITFEYSNTNVGAYTVCFNGNDALGLFLDGMLVDVIGDPTSSLNQDVAGVTSATADHTLIRKSTVTAGNINWVASAGTNEEDSEWLVQEVDNFGNIGSHLAGPVAYNFANSTVGTAFPQAGSEISISIDITPDEGIAAPTSVKVFYGTGGTQANQADMWLESGNTYAGTIPALSTGNTILSYYVSAIGSETINSSIYNITVAGATTNISDIHTNIVSYDGKLKTIEGVITIGAGVLRNDMTSCYIQDESGRGLNLYTGTVLTDLTKGTKIKLVGEVDLYYSTVEIKDFAYTVISTGNDRPAPIAATPATAANDNFEGTLVTLTGVLSEVQDFTTSKNMILTSGTDSAVVKVWPTTGIDPSTYTIGTQLAITGVGSKYSSEHQLLVGYTSDINDQVGICEDCIPETFAINKAYPNPFNPSTTIEFSLMDASDFEISIYNIAGQKMDILASGYAQPGIYKYVWNAADFTSGVYFVRLTADKNVATQKVVLIK